MPVNFEPCDPFPLVPNMDYSYEEAKSHSRLADHWLELKTYRTEMKIRTRLAQHKSKRNDKSENEYNEQVYNEQEWSGLAVQALLTPYFEIRSLLDLLPLQANQRIVDLGCAYARMGHVVGAYYPDLSFTGYEIAEERVREAQRVLKKFNYPRVEVLQQDLSLAEFTPAAADYYFIYDYGTAQSVQKSLLDLKNIALTKKIHVIARGRLSRQMIFQRHAWLCEVNPPQNFPLFTIFSS